MISALLYKSATERGIDPRNVPKGVRDDIQEFILNSDAGKSLISHMIFNHTHEESIKRFGILFSGVQAFCRTNFDEEDYKISQTRPWALKVNFGVDVAVTVATTLYECCAVFEGSMTPQYYHSWCIWYRDKNVNYHDNDNEPFRTYHEGIGIDQNTADSRIFNILDQTFRTVALFEDGYIENLEETLAQISQE